MSTEVWTVKSCHDWVVGYFRDHGLARPNLDAEWLICSACDLASRTELFMNYDRPLTTDELDIIHEGVVRRVKGEPLQYITGETQFRSISVMCTPGVLIPRPETESLVELVLDYLDSEVLGPDAREKRAVLPWNDEVQKAIEEEQAKAAQEEAAESGESEAHIFEQVDGSGADDEVFGARAYAEDRADRVDAGADFDGDKDAVIGDANVDAVAVSAGIDDVAEVVDAAGAVQTDAGCGEGGPDEPTQEPRKARVLEVGCGTGCISLSLATERSGKVFCYATDIEPRAVDLACKNRDVLGLDDAAVYVSLTNLVSSVPRDEWGTFDVLVSNPPYIPHVVMAQLPSEVADHEPALALDGGDDGLDIYRRLLNAAPHMLRPGGLFVCELFEDACQSAAELCRAAGLVNVEVVEDLTRRPRFVSARIPA